MNNIWRSMGGVSKNTKIALTLFLSAAAMGCTDRHEDADENSEGVKTEQVITATPQNDEISYMVYSNNMRLNPKADDFVDRCIALENLTCIPIVYTETYRATPVVQRKENVWTHGYGMTWSEDDEGRMKIRDYEKTHREKGILCVAHKPVMKRTKDKDLQESQQFLIDHVYSKIKTHLEREISLGEFYGLCVAGYQLEGHIERICKQLNKAKTPQQVADAFITPTMYNYGGTPKRRWVCAMLATGNITLEDVLNAYIDTFYNVDNNLSTIMKGKKHFICDRDTVDYVLGIKNKKLTRAEMMETADGRLALAQLEHKANLEVRKHAKKQKSESKVQKNAPEKKASTPRVDANFNKDYNAALKKYNAGKYADAAKDFAKLVTANPDNAKLRNDLALTYIKLNQYDNAISHLQYIFHKIKDKSQYASAYYNMGVAREKKGELPQALANYEQAAKSGNRMADNAVKRLSPVAKNNKEKQNKKSSSVKNAHSKSGNKKTQKGDENKKIKPKQKSKNKKTAFNDASKKLGNNAHSAGFDVSGLVFDGRDMA